MIKAFILTLLISLPAFAGETCKSAGLRSLNLMKIDEFFDRDICRLNTLTATEQSILDEIGLLNRKAADLFRVNVEQLFVAPITVYIHEENLGSHASFSIGSKLTIGVYPGSGFKFDPAIYIHELGHVLEYNNNPHLPASMKDISESRFFKEAFSDLLALIIEGNVYSPIINPSCIGKTRYITDFQTYLYPQGFFQNFEAMRIYECCDSILETSNNVNELGFCKAFQTTGRPGVDLETPFDPGVTEYIDSHQIGIPVLSMLKNFATLSKMSLREVFDRMFFPAGSQLQKIYSCEVKKGDEATEYSEKKLYSVETFLNDLRSGLSTELKGLFDKLYEKHSIAKGLKHSELEIVEMFQNSFRSGDSYCAWEDCEITCR